jgi:KDO2-lipid IV(A) lauroyltransferase
MLHVARGNAPLARRYARRSFAYYGTYLIDFLRFGGLTSADVRRAVAFDDWPRVERERRGNGIVFVTMHFGNWDLAGAALADRGLPTTVIADTFGHNGINDLVVGARRRLGMSIVPAERMGPGILRALRSNNMVAMLADIPYPTGVRVEFFGATVAVPDGAARIALRAGAPIMVGGVWRSGPSSTRYHADVERVQFEPTGSLEADVHGLTQAMMTALERLVERAPDQWYIFRSLWLDDRTEVAS